jgi:hypothetical protein
MIKAYNQLIENLVNFNHMKIPPKTFSALLNVGTLGSAVIISAVLFTFYTPLHAIAALILIPLSVQLLVLAYLYVSSLSKADEAESYLPNLLELIATNIKSGLTPDKAILFSLKGECGPFREQIRQLTKETITTKSLEESFMEIPKAYNSELIQNSFILITKGITGGGDISFLLEKTAQDIREVRSLKREVLADVNLHALFLVFAAIVGAPLLFGTTSFLLDELSVLSQRASSIFLSTAGTGFFYFAVAAISLNAFFASIMLGVIREGSKRQGLKYFPLFLVLSIALLFTVRYIMQIIFTAIAV